MRPHIALFLFAFALAEVCPAEDAPFSADQIEFFEAKVRPLLVKHCYECHSRDSKKLKGALRLDGRDLAIRGGDSGSAISPGKPAESLLLEAVRWESFEMPPSGKLKPAEVATLEKWIELGAPWPAEANSSAAKPSDAAPSAKQAAGYDWTKWRKEHWAFQPVKKRKPPRVADEAWPQSDVDRFVLSRLERAGLSPAPPAEPRVLVRRIYFDLVGLPPTPAEVDAFVATCERDRPQAVRELVDRLLASPHYGERWARHWLDVARYSDGHGGFLDNAEYAHAWRYRDWVVAAFNADMPFDKFIKLQIAGDILGDRRDAVATGFFALGPTYNSDGGDPDSVAQAQAETLSDRLDTLGRGMLGLTLACARCHDHKFDPLPQQDYYSLAGVFNNTAAGESPLAPPEAVDAFNQHQQAIKDCEKRINDARNKINNEKREPTPEEQRQLDEWTAELSQLRQSAPPPYATAHMLRDSGASDMPIAIRGDLRKPGEQAPRRFLRILAGDDAPPFDDASGRRQLAEAVAAPTNPLTARVMVNRIWMHHFGEALVRTPSNFGVLGEKPTHPQLLDWLTATFIESGQSIKSLHRAILLSSTYQMSSTFNEAAFRADGDNRLLWRMNPNRLDVESWRDALLSVTGELDPNLGGEPTDRVDSRRRTLYFKVSRNGDVFATDEFLRLFDFPLMRASVESRPTSIVPQQFLFLLNSPFMVERARALVKRLHADAAKSDADRIQLAYKLLYQRPPTAEEVDVGRAYIATAPDSNHLSPWEQYAQVLLGANEFMYVR
ncbi:MAG: PSD1 and planctomycete cytochrome C domain-containing protein [Pirellulales bacterium]